MHDTAAAHMQCGGQRPGKDSDSGGRMHAWTIDGSLAVALAPAVCSLLSFPFGGPSNPNLHPPDRSISLVRHPMIDKALLAVF